MVQRMALALFSKLDFDLLLVWGSSKGGSSEKKWRTFTYVPWHVSTTRHTHSSFSRGTPAKRPMGRLSAVNSLLERRLDYETSQPAPSSVQMRDFHPPMCIKGNHDTLFLEGWGVFFFFFSGRPWVSYSSAGRVKTCHKLVLPV